MRLTTLLALLAALLLLGAPAAQGASTKLLVKFSNQSAAPVKVTMWGQNYSSTQTAAPGKSISFGNRDKARLDDLQAHDYTFMARSLEPGNINCRGRVVVGNIWSAEPMVLNCDANIVFGDCQVTKQKRAMENCIIEIRTTE